MKIESIRAAVRFAGLVLPFMWTSGSLAAQMRLSGQASSYGVSIVTATVNQTSPAAVLPAGEMMATDHAQNITVNGLVSAQDAFAIVNGDLTDGSGAVSSATLGAVNILNGLITADGVVAMASSTVGSADAEGSSLGNLVVNGVAVSDPAPNTRMDLPGTGFVVLNEQIPTTGGITVNMIHVVMQQPILDLFGNVTGYQTIGNIIVGSATSSTN